MLFDGWGDVQWWVVVIVVAAAFLLLSLFDDSPRN